MMVVVVMVVVVLAPGGAAAGVDGVVVGALGDEDYVGNAEVDRQCYRRGGEVR